MAGKLEISETVVVTVGGRATTDFPPRAFYTPKKSVEVSNLPGSVRTFTIPKRNAVDPQPAPTLVWEWTSESGFPEFLTLEVESGSVCIAWLVDAATSTSDLSPAGTHEKVNEVDWSDYCAFRLNIATARVNATLATAAGLDADGKPAILTSAGTGSGYVYKMWVSNPSTTADVNVTIYTKG